MAKILIHVHVYYVKSWYKIEKCLKKIMADKSNEVKILTTVSAVIDDSDLYKIEKTRIPNMSLIRVPNDGYDIQPFFLLLKSVSLEQYDYLIKLHTKNDVYGIDVKSNGRYISRAQWSNFLMDAIASTPKAFKENINKMQADPAIGMIGSSYFISKVSSSDEEEKRLIPFESSLPKCPLHKRAFCWRKIAFGIQKSERKAKINREKPFAWRR